MCLVLLVGILSLTASALFVTLKSRSLEAKPATLPPI
jgi:hypothetical protein